MQIITDLKKGTALFSDTLKLAVICLPYLLIFMIFMLVFGLYHALVVSPPDYQMGDVVRIMYVHVPAVYGAVFSYFILFLCSVFVVFKNSQTAYIIGRSIAPIGFALTVLGLVSGSIWGKPTWGTWWVWDARLTSFFAMSLIYGCHLIWNMKSNPCFKVSNAPFWLVIVGFLNVPIIKFSVVWWTTLHQPTTLLRTGGASINDSMLFALLLMFGFMTLFIVCTLIMRTSAWNILIKKGNE